MNMTGRNMGKLLVVPTFVARRLHLCKDTRGPSSESWNYLSRRLSCNFAEKIAFTPFRDVSGSPNMSWYKLHFSCLSARPTAYPCQV